MAELQVSILPLHPRFTSLELLPRRMSEHAAGFDLCAAIDTPLTLQPGERALVPCGFAMAFAEGFEAQVRPRSGLALRHGVTLLNSPGTIDADYRGEVRVILINLGQQAHSVQPGERVAQMVFARVTQTTLSIVEALDASDRGAGGFGSTGR